MEQQQDRYTGWPLSKYRRDNPWHGELTGPRRWPDAEVTSPPRLCSVDLRDGNQALPSPLSPQAKLDYAALLVRCGFQEIEMGFPAASQDDWQACREMLAAGVFPTSVTPQVLTTAHPHLIERTFAAIDGAYAMRVHFFNTISPQQCAVVFGEEFQGPAWVAEAAAQACLRQAPTASVEHLSFQYSPECFTQAPLREAQQVCAAVMDVLQPTSALPLIINLPATVEACGPHRYADAVEAMVDFLPADGSVVVSVHPHNDRGTAVAAAELAVLAGAQRVEGCLFGHGERAGNVCLLTVAMNLVAQGIDPGVYFPDVGAVAHEVASLTGIDVPARHPYAGRLVFTALAGTHQDAIDKALRQAEEQGESPIWDVPYLPLDPRDLGRSLDTVIELSDQSGKSGVGHVVRREFGIDVPPPLRRAWARLLGERPTPLPAPLTPGAVSRALEPASAVPGSLPWGPPRAWTAAEDSAATSASDLPLVLHRSWGERAVWVAARRQGATLHYVASAQLPALEGDVLEGWRVAIASTPEEAVGLLAVAADEAQWTGARIP